MPKKGAMPLEQYHKPLLLTNSQDPHCRSINICLWFDNMYVSKKAELLLKDKCV
jgi:hypothetical protein